MKPQTFQTQLWLPRPLDEVFAFFADARNLQNITPDWLSFSVLTPGEISMKPGALIDYQLRVHGIPLRWRTEITAWEPPHRFVDEQRRGPYRLWKHEHRFETRDNGTEIVDMVTYLPRGGLLVDWLFVRRDVEKIFGFRRKRLIGLFGGA